MCRPDSPETTYKLKARVACFLEGATEDHKRVSREIGEFYNTRSAIVHRQQDRV